MKRAEIIYEGYYLYRDMQPSHLSSSESSVSLKYNSVPLGGWDRIFLAFCVMEKMYETSCGFPQR